jgi:thiamine biosynthesis protein ThiI
VASQTIHNLAAIGPDVTLPVFRPVIGTDKHEISELARRIGTFNTSVEPYRDCCSIRSPHPLLRARPAEIMALSEQMDLDGAIEEAVNVATKEKIKK